MIEKVVEKRFLLANWKFFQLIIKYSFQIFLNIMLFQ